MADERCPPINTLPDLWLWLLFAVRFVVPQIDIINNIVYVGQLHRCVEHIFGLRMPLGSRLVSVDIYFAQVSLLNITSAR